MNAPQPAARLAPPVAPDPLGTALSEALDRYVARRPTSERLQREAAEVLPGGNTRSVLFFPPFPPYMAGGEGCRLTDVDGHVYLDALGEFTAGLYGHSDPVIREALEHALRGGLNLSSHTPGEAALAREIQARIPSIERLRFTNSGTEANLLALAAAVAHTGRRTVLVFEGAYHGGVLSFPAGAPAKVNVPHAFAPRSSRTAATWPRSWSSRCSAPAAASPATRPSSTGCARSPTSTARCWCSTR